jgi:hypothetical protein
MGTRAKEPWGRQPTTPAFEGAKRAAKNQGGIPMTRQAKEQKRKAEVIYEEYTYDELQEAFSRVHNPDDWRAPILVRCKGEAVNLVVAAIKFYTATNPTVSLNTKTMDYVIESEGYRAGPAGDH